MVEEFKQRSVFRNYYAALTLGFGGFYFGYYVSCFNALTKPMLHGVLEYDESSPEYLSLTGLVNFIFALGALLGVLLSGNLADKLGRRAILYSGEVLALIAVPPYMVAHTGSLLVARFISGMVAGINYSIFAVILAETLPNRLCGLANGFSCITLASGVVLSSLNQNVFDYDTITQYWRWFLLYPLVVTFIRLVSFLLLFRTDTPKYIFMAKGNLEAAREEVKKSLQSVYSDEQIEQVTQTTLELLQREQMKGKVSTMAMFSKRYRKQLFSGCWVATIQQWGGIYFLILYSTSVFDRIAGIGKLMALLIGIGNLIGGILSTILIPMSGRKPNLVYGCLCEGIGWLLMLIGKETSQVSLLIIGSLIFIITFAIGLGGTITAYICEILPPPGVGLSFACLWIFTAVTGLVFPPLTNLLGESVMMGAFAVICLLGSLGLHCWTIETKGKTQEDIEAEFNKIDTEFIPAKMRPSEPIQTEEDANLPLGKFPVYEEREVELLREGAKLPLENTPEYEEREPSVASERRN